MDEASRRERLRSFALGSLVGASAALAAARRSRPPARRAPPGGLAAFEDAPCFREIVEEGPGPAPARRPAS